MHKKKIEFVQKLGKLINYKGYEEVIYKDEATLITPSPKEPICWLRQGMKLTMHISKKCLKVRFDFSKGNKNSSTFGDF